MTSPSVNGSTVAAATLSGPAASSVPPQGFALLLTQLGQDPAAPSQATPPPTPPQPPQLAAAPATTMPILIATAVPTDPAKVGQPTGTVKDDPKTAVDKKTGSEEPTSGLGLPLMTETALPVVIGPSVPPTPPPVAPAPSSPLDLGASSGPPVASSAGGTRVDRAQIAVAASVGPTGGTEPSAPGAAAPSPEPPEASKAEPEQSAGVARASTMPARISDQPTVAGQASPAPSLNPKAPIQAQAVVQNQIETAAGSSNPLPSVSPAAPVAAASPQPATQLPVAAAVQPADRKSDDSSPARSTTQQPSFKVTDVKTAPDPAPVTAAVAEAPLSTLTAPLAPAAIVPSASVVKPVPSTVAPPTPATQVAQALVEPVKVVLTSPSQAGSSEPHVTTIQIAPAELGRVEIRIARSSDGPAKIELVAERPETLSRLVHDQSTLHLALDQAGITSNARTIEFSLAPTPPATNGSSSTLTGGQQSGDNPAGNGSQRQPNRYANPAAFPDEAVSAVTTQSRSLRSGIDITA